MSPSPTRPSDGKISILIADDHPSVRLGLSFILSAEPDTMVVGQAATGAEAVSLHRQHRPDITLMDLNMPSMSGVEAVRSIRSNSPRAKIIVLTAYDRVEDIFRSIRSGAEGYVLKDAPVEELLTAIRRVHEGSRYFPSEIIERIAGRLSMAELRDREMEVLLLLIEGKSNLEIARALTVGVGTVKFHVKNILTKLGASDRTHAVVIALRRGLADL
jgi:two-component system NarL family response regulator